MPADTTTIARPYAKAAFHFALQFKALAEWSQFLQTAAFVSCVPAVIHFLQHPSTTPSQHYDLFADVCASVVDESRKNFLRLLADNNRLAVLAEVAFLFETLRAEQEKIVDVDVASFMPLSDEQQKQIMETLKQRLQRDVVLRCDTDPSLLGGAVIRAGDLVIDGSVRSKLNKMRHALTA